MNKEMLGKEKFASVDEAIDTYLIDYAYTNELTKDEYNVILNTLTSRNEYVWQEMTVKEIFYEVEAFVEGFIQCKKFYFGGA